jgi:SAM-dependent methyltransferase
MIAAQPAKVGARAQPSTASKAEVPGAARLFSLLTAFLSSSAVFSAVELGVFDALERGPATAEALGERIRLPPRPARVLLLALLGERLVECIEGRYENSELAKVYLVSSSPQYVGPLVEHQATHFGKFMQLTEALRQDKPVTSGENYSAGFGGGEAWAQRLVAVLNASAKAQAPQLAAKVDLKGRRRLVDLGCGSGAYSVALALANPELEVLAVDSPKVVGAAQAYVAEAGVGSRVRCQPGDISKDSFPTCDVAFVSHVLGGWSRDRAAAFLRHVYEWLPPGGELILHEHLPSVAQSTFPYMFGLIMVVNNSLGGEVHDEALLRKWLEEIGFRNVEVSPVTGIAGLLRATK